MNQEQIDAVNEQEPSTAILEKAVAAIASAHPEMKPGEHRTRAATLVSRGAFGLDGQGEILFKPHGIEHIRVLAPGLLAEWSAPRPTKIQRAMTKEIAFNARLAEARKPAITFTPRELRAQVDAALAALVAQDETLQGNSARVKARLSIVRQQIRAKVLAEAGVTIRGLDFDGVTS